MAYSFEQDGSGATDMVLHGRWDGAARTAWEEHEADGLVLNAARGFEGDISFLRQIHVRRLLVIARYLDDVSPIYDCAEGLERLSLSPSPAATLDLSRLPDLRSLSVESWRQIRSSAADGSRLEDLYVGHFGEADLRAVTGWTRLRRLRLKDRPMVRSLSGVEELQHLEHLQVVGASRLTDFEALDAVNEHLETLWIESCKRLDRIDFVRRLRSLVELTAADCGPIESLAPIRGLPRLRAVLLWESTDIADGDLSPLLTVPNLTTVRLRSRRHYEPSSDEVARRISKS